jgi:hypothetical protein
MKQTIIEGIGGSALLSKKRTKRIRQRIAYGDRYRRLKAMVTRSSIESLG